MKMSLYERRRGAVFLIILGFCAMGWNYISGVSLSSRPNNINFLAFFFLTVGILHLLQAKLLEAKVIEEKQFYDFMISFGPMPICTAIFTF